MISNKHKGDFMCRELAALNNEVGGDEHAQWILLSSVKASLYAQGRVYVPRARVSNFLYRISSKNSALLIIQHLYRMIENSL